MTKPTEMFRPIPSRPLIAAFALIAFALLAVSCASDSSDGGARVVEAAQKAATAAENASVSAEAAAEAARQAGIAAQDDSAAQAATEAAQSASEAAQAAAEAARRADSSAQAASVQAKAAAQSLATAVAPPTEVLITHYSGADTVPVNPETVVVFDLGVLLSLHDLGIEVDAVGGLGIPIPEEYDAIVNSPDYVEVGTAFEPDYEAVNAMEPDLIIVASRSSRWYAEMSRIAPTVDLTVDWDDYMNSFRDTHRSMGKIFNVESKVEDKLAKLDAEIARVRSQAAGAGKALILMTTGAEVTAYGPGSRFGFVHDLFGYAAADESLERDATHGDAVSFEYILEAAPDALFVIDRAAAIGGEGDAARQILDNELVTQTPAWQNERVVYVDNFAWYIAASSLPSYFMIADNIANSF